MGIDENLLINYAKETFLPGPTVRSRSIPEIQSKASLPKLCLPTKFHKIPSTTFWQKKARAANTKKQHHVRAFKPRHARWRPMITTSKTGNRTDNQSQLQTLLCLKALRFLCINYHILHYLVTRPARVDIGAHQYMYYPAFITI